MIYYSPVGIIKIKISDEHVSEILYSDDKSETSDDAIRIYLPKAKKF